jgi:hypothetical protein
MPMKNRYEIRLACTVLATLSIVVSQLLLFPTPHIDAQLDDFQQIFTGWFLLSTSALLIISLIVNCRALRQWSLGLNGIAWVVLAVILFSMWASPKTVGAVAIVGFVNVFFLYRDVHGKPRSASERLATSKH